VEKPRIERFTVVLTEEERERLDKMAEEAGIDRSTLVRLRLFGGAAVVAGVSGETTGSRA